MAAPEAPADPADPARDPRSGADRTGVLIRTVIENCAVATVDAHDTEYASGHVVVAGNRVESVGPGPAPADLPGVPRRVDGTGHLLTPGLVNTHHHFYQWLTRGLAQDAGLFDWLVALYSIWARIDEPMVYEAARGSLAMMARGGVTTAMDHHYVFPHGAGDLLGADIRAARELGVRFSPTRGSMDLGTEQGGLPPDFAVETTEAALTATEAAIDAHHDPSLRLDAARRRRALLAVLRLHRTPARRRDAGPPQGGAAAHPRLQDGAGGTVLQGDVRHGPHRLLRVHRLAR